LTECKSAKTGQRPKSQNNIQQRSLSSQRNCPSDSAPIFPRISHDRNLKGDYERVSIPNLEDVNVGELA